MCINIEIILPTIETFLLIYSLRSGSTVILFWNLFRCLFSLLFFMMAILELLIHEKSLFGAWLAKPNYQVPHNLVVPLFYIFILLIICEATLIIYTMILGYGICVEKPRFVKHYLVCRFVTWMTEVIFLSILSIIHKFLIGYYLSILLFVVLEFYSVIVVYSYLVTITELDADDEDKNDDS